MMRKRLGIGIVVLLFLIGVGLGFTVGKNVAGKLNVREFSNSSFGIRETDFAAKDIQWKDFIGWKTVTFRLSGTMTVWVPEGTEVSFEEPELEEYGMQRTVLSNPDAWRETGREQKKYFNGETIVSYDVISLEADELEIEGTITDGNNILENKYLLNIYFRDSKMDANRNAHFTVGAILADTQELQVWSEQERQYAGRNLSVYLDAYQLSDTYMDGTLTGREKATDISLTKGDDTLYHCTISNQSGEEWIYSGDLPAVELWYEGVWMELESPLASNLSLLSIAPNEQKVINPSGQELITPYLFPGLYRLVVYGQEGDYIATEPFEIQE